MGQAHSDSWVDGTAIVKIHTICSIAYSYLLIFVLSTNPAAGSNVSHRTVHALETHLNRQINPSPSTFSLQISRPSFRALGLCFFQDLNIPVVLHPEHRSRRDSAAAVHKAKCGLFGVLLHTQAPLSHDPSSCPTVLPWLNDIIFRSMMCTVTSPTIGTSSHWRGTTKHINLFKGRCEVFKWHQPTVRIVHIW